MTTTDPTRIIEYKIQKMNTKIIKPFLLPLLIMSLALILSSCSKTPKQSSASETSSANETIAHKYPSDVIPFMDEWRILLGDGTRSDKLKNFEKEDFFYVSNEGDTDWVVYKSPNAGVTSRTSSNTRSELGQLERWKPEKGGKLTGTLKVMHVSTLGDATKPSSYSVVVGQIHSDEGHENEPLKIYFKKFPGHSKGSVFWNYEINTEGDNSKRWDFSSAVWGYDMSIVGSSATSYPEEPKGGIELGEEFSYEVNVHQGIMYLTFTSDGHETIKFTKDLTKSDFTAPSDIPQQVLTSYRGRGRDGTEREIAYADELQYFKQGAYNQTQAKAPVGTNESSDVENTIERQYSNGCYTEVWFKKATVGAGTLPLSEQLR